MDTTQYKETFTPDGDTVIKYVRTFQENGLMVEVCLTRDYIAKTDKRVIDRYLNHAVTDILTRNGVEQ
jgi:hypothetical protein